MGMKFLNKKGWHTGSLRNIENVWKAEQKHDAEQKKLEELRKQLHEERERLEFRQLQEQAGLIPRQERLEFLYESGLAVGKGSGSSFKELDSLPKTAPEPSAPATAAAEKPQVTPGALFEDTKPQSANDAWRKLHSDPLLLIRQREQEALARVKNNPVQMAMIRKSVEAKKEKKTKKHSSKKHGKKSKHREHSPSENESDPESTALLAEKQKESRQRGSRSENHLRKEVQSSDEEPHRGDTQKMKYNDKEYTDRRPKHDELYGDQRSKRRHYDSKGRDYSSERHVESRNDRYEETDDDRIRKRPHDSKSERKDESRNVKYEESVDNRMRSRYDSRHREQSPERRHTGYRSKHEQSNDDRVGLKSRYDTKNRENRSERHVESRSNKHEETDGDQKRRNSHHDSKSREQSSERPLESRNDKPNHVSSDKPPRSGPNNKPRPVKLTEEERAAKLREMQMDAEKHEEQRWKRLKKAEDTDAQEAARDKASLGRNFLHAAHKSVYGAEKGGSSTIEESVRRRTHYLQQGRSATDTNAFRR